MKTLVVLAHPVAGSFNASIHREVCEALAKRTFEVQTLDLYQEDFDPRLTARERKTYMEKNNTTTVHKYVEQLQWAEALILIYPTWWMGPPAILKGWLDRVWLPSVVAKFGPNGVTPRLTGLKKIMIITTQGASRWRMALIGNPPRRIMTLSLKAVTRCNNIQWLALHRIDKINKPARDKFLQKVRRKIQRL